MLFVAIGVLIIIFKIAEVGPFGTWNLEFFGDLWKFTIPFLCAIAWWIYSDRSGLNKRREIERMEKKKQNRREENLVSLGMNPRAGRKKQR